MCPDAIKEILYRAAERVNVHMVLVANAMLHPPPSKYISAIRVTAGLNMADEEIARRCERGDLVITADIPLASSVIGRGAFVLDPRGELFTEENITERLSMRNFMNDLRSSGIDTGGPSALSRRDHQAFANALDRFLTQWLNTRKLHAEKSGDTGRNSLSG